MAELATTALFTDPNLVAYYKLEDVNDSKASFNFTNNGTVEFNAAEFTNGADFLSANSSRYLTVASNLGITGGASSYSFWIKLRDAITALNTPFMLQAQADGGNMVAFYIQYIYNSGNPQLNFYRQTTGVSNDIVTVTVTLSTSSFSHLVLTYDGSNVYAYVDNVQYGPTASTGNGIAPITSGFTIGADAATPTQYASAIIDDFGIFSRALTISEVSTLYSSSGAGGAGALSTKTKMW